MSRKVAFILGTGAASLAILAVGGAAFTANTLRVVRRPADPKVPAVEILAADGARLRAAWLANGSKSCVLLLHGISDSRASMTGFVKMFAEHGYSALAPDSRGHGESGGDLVTYGILESGDLARWAQWLSGAGESADGAIVASTRRPARECACNLTPSI